MQSPPKLGVIFIFCVTLLTACANTDVVLRPERTTYIPVQKEMPKIRISGTDELELRCWDWKGKTESGDGADKQCLYYATDEQEIFSNFRH
jgi:hypothetical protein